MVHLAQVESDVTCHAAKVERDGRGRAAAFYGLALGFHPNVDVGFADDSDIHDCFFRDAKSRKKSCSLDFCFVRVAVGSDSRTLLNFCRPYRASQSPVGAADI